MSFLAKLFQPKGNRDVLYSLDYLDSSALAETMCYTEIKARALEAAISNPNVIRKMQVIESRQPLEIALTLIINLCAQDLSSGIDHVYRGTLSARGAAKRALFKQAQTMMVERGFIEQEDADHGFSLIGKQIQEVG